MLYILLFIKCYNHIMIKNNNNEVYQLLSSLFNLSKTISKIKKKLNNEEDRKSISENYIEECNKLLSIKTDNDEQNFMVASFIISNNNIIDWCLKYCNNNTKEDFQKNQFNISSFSN